jgi:hypothetical protein
MRKYLLLISAAILFASSAAFAHHSYAATYDTTKEIKVEGKLVQFELRNPHTFVTVTSKNENGKVERWSVEWAGSSQLANSGVKQETLKIGDSLVIVGNPSRVPGEFRMLMVNLKRPLDGFNWGTKPGEKVD